LNLRIRPAGDDARMLLPGDWLAWAREARCGWRWRRNALIRELRFRDFDNSIAFLEEVGRRGADYSRRPDMAISGGRVRLTIANPNHAGITLAELRVAAKVNMVVQELADDRLSGRSAAYRQAHDHRRQPDPDCCRSDSQVRGHRPRRGPEPPRDRAHPDDRRRARPLLRDPERARPLGRGALERVREHFTSPRSLLDYLAVIRRVLAPPREGVPA
jgi:pterin-4a-carbinolamine dehydratase